MKLVYLCDRLYHERKVPRTRFHSVDAIGRLISVRCTGNGFYDWDQRRTVAENLADDRPDAILVYKPEFYHGWDNQSLPPVITTFNDAWDTEARIRDIQLPRCRMVVMHHANEMAEWATRFPNVTFVNIPYPVNPDVFKNYDIHRVTDVLLTGAVDEDIYPLRYRFSQLIRQNAFAPYRAIQRPHSGYRLQDPESEAKSYARALSMAKICLADTSKYGYFAEKLHEIPACGSVLCTNFPGERCEDLKRFAIIVHPCDSDNRIVDTIKWYLERPALLDEMAKAGNHYVHSQFTTDHYAARFVQELGKIL